VIAKDRRSRTLAELRAFPRTDPRLHSAVSARFEYSDEAASSVKMTLSASLCSVPDLMPTLREECLQTAELFTVHLSQ
jgi:hypothetical protein